MITRITIKSEPADRTSKDRLTVTRSSVRYEYEPSVPSVSMGAGARAWTGGQGKKWTVTSRRKSFETMFENLCEEVAALFALPEGERPSVPGAGTTTFTVMHDDGKKEERTLSVPDETYTVCFTIIDQMVKSADPGRTYP